MSFSAAAFFSTISIALALQNASEPTGQPNNLFHPPSVAVPIAMPSTRPSVITNGIADLTTSSVTVNWGNRVVSPRLPSFTVRPHTAPRSWMNESTRSTSDAFIEHVRSSIIHENHTPGNIRLSSLANSALAHTKKSPPSGSPCMAPRSICHDCLATPACVTVTCAG